MTVPRRDMYKYTNESYIAILPLLNKKDFEKTYEKLVGSGDILALLSDMYYAIRPQALKKLDSSHFRVMWTYPLTSEARRDIRHRLQEKGVVAPI
ncbi:MAG: hypothetical protein FJ004_10965 [Chloroflexi bacterium]|nr:hypothetical protein [Chloroflexota bacterium]